MLPRIAILLLVFAAACSDDPDANGADAGPNNAGPNDANHSEPDANHSDPDADHPAPDADHPDPDADHPDPDANSPADCTPHPWPQADFFAAPDGATDAAGTADEPLALAILLSPQGPAGPGDRVELLEGTYTGRFTANVSGTSDQPIVFAARPGTVILDSHAESSGDTGLFIEGAHLEFHDLIITNSHPSRFSAVSGVTIHGEEVRLINSVIHDTAQGVSFWTPAIDSELYGNIIYNNGYMGDTRGHGHAVYTQNRHGTKRLARNILFFGYGFGFHAYTEGGYIEGFDFEENLWFRTGASRPDSTTVGTSDGLLVGGLQPVDRARLLRNYSWAPTPDARSTRIGWGGDVMNEHITMIDNYLVGHFSAQGHWAGAEIHGNDFYSTYVGILPADWPDNAYHEALPDYLHVVVHKNHHDPTRAELYIYNWDDLPEVAIDGASLLPEGATYTVHSVFDLFGDPVASGTYEGGDLTIPMGTVDPPQPKGDPGNIGAHDDPGATFGAFVVRADCSLLP